MFNKLRRASIKTLSEIKTQILRTFRLQIERGGKLSLLPAVRIRRCKVMACLCKSCRKLKLPYVVKSIAILIDIVLFIIRVLSYNKGVFFYFCIRRIKWKWKHTPHLRFWWNISFLQVGNFLYLFSNFKKFQYSKQHNLFKAIEQVHIF